MRHGESYNRHNENIGIILSVIMGKGTVRATEKGTKKKEGKNAGT